MYFAIRKYKTLKDGDTKKENIDRIYEGYKNQPGNARKNKETFLKDSIIAMNTGFAKEMRARRKS